MRWNLPNALTASRLPLAALFGWLLLTGHSRATLLAVFALAALTDLFDGLAARALGQVTHGGAVLDQWMDRAFTAPIVALPGVLIALARGRRLYHVEFVGKLATFVQSVTLGAIIAAPPFAPALALACALVGVASGASHLRYALHAARARGSRAQSMV